VLRNPWGASEWTGAWGDGSKEWTGEWLDVLGELNYVFGDDGEFVMEYSDFLDTFELIERTTLFDSSWVTSSHWLRLPLQRPNHLWTFGDLSFKFTLNKPSFTIISLSQLDTRYFQEISGNSKWNIDFVLYKRGETEITGVSYYAHIMVRSVTTELNLEAGEYIIFPRCDRYSYYENVEERRPAIKLNPRILARVLTEKARAQSIAVNSDDSDNIYIPKTINTLIEQDLQKLEFEKNIVDNDDDADEDEEEGEVEVEEEGEVEVEEDEEPVNADGNSEKADGDSKKGSGKELVTSDLPGFPCLPHESLEKPQDDDDGLVLGVRIYTQGGAVVSVTGQVVNEEIVGKDEYDCDNAAKAKEDDKKPKRL